MALILEWFLYFSIALSVGSESLSANGLVSLNSGILRFLTAFEKKRIKGTAFCSSWVVTVSSSTKVIFSFDLVLLFSRTAYYRQYLLHSSLYNNLFWLFLEKTRLRCFTITKRSNYFVLHKIVYCVQSIF